MASSRFNDLVRSVKWMITHKRNYHRPECETITIDGQLARVDYSPEAGLYRGEFVGLEGRADFYAKDLESLITEGKASLLVYLEATKEPNR
tara:strand:- start:730 stop:1002 length:273 start_codon:yes stop_codon:yes gene_type:complete